MSMWRITFLLLATITGISCDRSPRTAAPIRDTVAPSDDPEIRRHHPTDHPLREVPILIGLPTKEMEEEVRKGKALLGGCMGTPGVTHANVCERCRRWKTNDMKYWEPLPREFGEAAAADQAPR